MSVHFYLQTVDYYKGDLILVCEIFWKLINNKTLLFFWIACIFDDCCKSLIFLVDFCIRKINNFSGLNWVLKKFLGTYLRFSNSWFRTPCFSTPHFFNVMKLCQFYPILQYNGLYNVHCCQIGPSHESSDNYKLKI